MLVIAVAIAFMLSCSFIFYIRHRDKRLWNDGRCQCGGKWEFFGLTASGSRIYKCEYCDDDIIISELEYF